MCVASASSPDVKPTFLRRHMRVYCLSRPVLKCITSHTVFPMRSRPNSIGIDQTRLHLAVKINLFYQNLDGFSKTHTVYNDIILGERILNS